MSVWGILGRGLIAPLVVALLTSCGTAPTADDQAAARGAVLFGGNEAFTRLPQVGSAAAIVRTYHRLGSVDAGFPNAAESAVLDSGATLLTSIVQEARDGWASILTGIHDDALLTFLRSLHVSAVEHQLPEIYVSFNHEPDIRLNSERGTPAQFVAAWRHVHNLADSAGLTSRVGGRLKWVWILTAEGFGVPGRASQYWPGTGTVDAIGVDGYLSGACRRRTGDYINPAPTTEHPGTIFNAALRWSADNAPSRPVVVAEWGSVPFTDPTLRRGFIDAMVEYVAQHPRIAAVLYWNAHGKGNACDYAVDDDPAALGALAAMSRDPRLHSRAPTRPAAPSTGR